MNREAGFTLMEVLVALVIVGLALGGVFSSIGMSARAAAESLAERQALQQAQSFLDRLGREIPVRDGTTSGDWSGGRHWTLDIKPLPDQPDARQSILLGHLTTLTVDWTQNGGPRRLEFHSLLLGPAS